MKRQWLAGIGLALCAAPTVVGISGCNGDNDSGGPFAPTPTPTQAASQSFAAPVNFGNGQGGTLNLRVQGTQATGTLTVRARAAVAQVGSRGGSADAFTFALPTGTFNLTGTFSPPRGFNVTGTLPTIGTVRINGTIPTQTQSGAFTVAANGQSTTGTIPALNTLPTPTATSPGATPTATRPGGATPTPTRPGSATPTPTRPGATPTATPPVTTTGQRLVGRISATTSDYNGLTGALNLPQFSSGVDTGSIAAVFSDFPAQPEFSLQLNLNPANGSESAGVTPGTYVVVGGGEARNSQVSIRQRGFSDSFFATSGNVVVESVQSGILRFRLVNVRFETFEGRNAPPPAPRGDFTLNASGQLRTSCSFPAQCR